MKPKTKYQKHLCELNKRVKPITSAQHKYAVDHCVEHYAYVRAKSLACFDCGHRWELDTSNIGKSVRCPKCGQELTVQHDSRKRVYSLDGYCNIVTVVDGYQLVRCFYLNAKYRVGEKAEYSSYEVTRHWIEPSGKVTLFSRLKAAFYTTRYTGCPFSRCSNIELRAQMSMDTDDVVADGICPRMKVLPILYRNGFDGNFHKCTPTELFAGILRDNFAETLLKVGQYPLLKTYLRTNYHLPGALSEAVKICLRHSYYVADAKEYNDYIQMAQQLNLDLHNPKVACPDDLTAAHDRLVVATERQRERERRRQERQRLEDDKKAIAKFVKQKNRYFGITLSDDNIVVVVLDSVEAYEREADAMHHCVFASRYYSKPESLILSARTPTGDRIETVELSLSNYKVLQSRGACNQNTPYHEEIISLVEKNAGLFRKAKRSPQACAG